MRLLNTIFLAACTTIAAASEPIVTAMVKRSDSCATLPAGPTDSGWDSSLTITSIGTSPTTSSSAAATMSCEHAADPNGAIGLCPNLADGGWCDCGADGTYEVLAGSSPCGYSTVPPSGSIALTSTDCVTSTELITETVVPIPVSTAS